MGRNATAANKWNSVIVTADPLIVSRPYMRVAWYLRVVIGTLSYIQTDVDNESSCVRDVPPHNSSAATQPAIVRTEREHVSGKRGHVLGVVTFGGTGMDRVAPALTLGRK